MADKPRRITIAKDGPYLVTGSLPLARLTIGVNAAGESVRWERGETIATGASYALCRCGRSGKKPFCDGTHAREGFDGAETASRAPYLEQAGVIDGPTLRLTDAESLCAFARFCDPAGRVWNLVERSDDPEARRVTVHEAGACPGGRLVAWERTTGAPHEPRLVPQLGLIEDPAQGCSGGIAAWGGVEVVGADGTAYEVRNRVTLCRCGESSNKPFCDGTHASMKFSDAT
ncbi:MAG TPA: CDGSH iron-sulfur domain-containing protein [Anaeromyxobacteraceae bacterium]|nr:CDGSH iron-sulfur domain-containing protein [Anaeromyxobacteraceae bacterium]